MAHRKHPLEPAGPTEPATARKHLIDVLLDNPATLSRLARLLEATPKAIEDDLVHLLKSLKHTDYRARVSPARCRKCGFIFDRAKLRKPGKCPACRGTWVSEPVVSIERRR